MVFVFLYLASFYFIGKLIDFDLRRYQYSNHKFIVNTCISFLHACIACVLGLYYIMQYDNYQLQNSFDINNILDENYETARDYSQMDRSFNFGIRRSY